MIFNHTTTPTPPHPHDLTDNTHLRNLLTHAEHLWQTRARHALRTTPTNDPLTRFNTASTPALRMVETHAQLQAANAFLTTINHTTNPTTRHLLTHLCRLFLLTQLTPTPPTSSPPATSPPPNPNPPHPPRPHHPHPHPHTTTLTNAFHLPTPTSPTSPSPTPTTSPTSTTTSPPTNPDHPPTQPGTTSRPPTSSNSRTHHRNRAARRPALRLHPGRGRRRPSVGDGAGVLRQVLHQVEVLGRWVQSARLLELLTKCPRASWVVVRVHHDGSRCERRERGWPRAAVWISFA